jgi:hypothetical protein
VTDLLFPDHPADTVNDIGFAATVGSYDPRDIVVEVHDRFISKTFESLDF